jgi:hypothetical protein
MSIDDVGEELEADAAVLCRSRQEKEEEESCCSQTGRAGEIGAAE